MKWMLVIGIIFLGIICFGGADGDTIIVDDDEGAWADYENIQDAIDNATVNDTILIYNGSYDAQIEVNKTLSIIGNGSDATNLTESWRNSVLLLNDNTVFGGFNITGIASTAGPYYCTVGITVNADNCELFDINCTDFYNGFLFEDSNNNHMDNSSVTSNGTGVLIVGCNATDFFNLSIYSNDDGMSLDESNHTTVSNCTFYNNSLGLSSSGSHDNLFRNITLNRNGISISCGHSRNETFTALHLSNTDSELELHGCVNISVNDAKFDRWGIDLNGWQPETLTSHEFTDCFIDDDPIIYLHDIDDEQLASITVGQLILVYCTNMTIEDIEATGGDPGILMWSCNESRVNNTIVHDARTGFQLWYSNRIELSNCSAYDNDYGLRHHGSNNIISMSNFSSNRINGIRSRSEVLCKIIDCLVDDNEEDGIYIFHGDHEIRNCSAERNGGDGLFLHTHSSLVHSSDFSNNSNAGIRVAGGSPTMHAKIINCTSSYNGNEGIYVYGLYHRIENTTIHHNKDGLVAMSCIEGSFISLDINNNTGNGVILGGRYGSLSKDCILVNCSILDNGENGTLVTNSYLSTIAFKDTKAFNWISTNTISGNLGSGIHIFGSSDNVVRNNSITDNGEWGVYIGHLSNNNSIHSNNLINNSNQISQAFDFNGYNRWSHRGSGNHWSDYSGADDNGDGVGDSNYWIKGTMPNWSFESGSRVVAATSDDGKYVVVGTYDEVSLLDTELRKRLWRYGTDGYVIAVGMSPDGSHIAASTSEDLLFLFHRNSSSPQWNYSTNRSIRSISISENGDYIAVGSGRTSLSTSTIYYNYLKFFGKNSSTPLWDKWYKAHFVHTAISNDGNIIAVGTECIPKPSILACYGKNSSDPRWKRSYNTRSVSGVDISWNGSYIASRWGDSIQLNGNGSTAYIWYNDTGRSFIGPVFSGDGTKIMIGSNDDNIYIYNLNSSKPEYSWNLGGDIGSMAISRSGNIIVGSSTDDHMIVGSSADDHLIRAHDIENSTDIWNYTSDTLEGSIFINDDGSIVITVEYVWVHVFDGGPEQPYDEYPLMEPANTSSPVPIPGFNNVLIPMTSVLIIAVFRRRSRRR